MPLAVQDQQHAGGAQHDAATAAHTQSDAGKKADQAGADAAAKRMAQSTPAPQAKDGGMLSHDATTKLGALPKGTAVEVVAVHGAQLTVKVWSGHGGAQTDVPLASFQAEPALAMKDDAPGQRDDYTYEEYTSVLWGPGGPSAGDVSQGYLGDCYFNAAMGAVAAANPGKIKSLFTPATPNQKSYQVTLYATGRDGKLSAKTFSVDTNLPTRAKAPGSISPAYSGNNSNFADHKAPLWPALLEKAYAEMTRGGYAKVGDGGSADVAMQVLTGDQSHDESSALSKDPKSLLERFRQLQASGAAIACGTLSGIQKKGEGGFTGQGPGPFVADLKNDFGSAAEVVKSTLTVKDKKGKAPAAHDDGQMKVVGAGVDSGSVSYSSGHVELHYKKDHAPAAAADLAADFQWEGMIAPDLHLYGDHEYIFESVQGDSLVFKNPWGIEHPAPIPVARFKSLFDEMASNPAGKAKDKPKG